MKWVNVNNNASTENFELWEDEKMLADISFSNQTRFARIVSKLGKRIFSFEKKGFLTQRKFIRNEYGIKLGMLEEFKPGSGKGIVELDGKRYNYVFDENNSGELKLYDESMQQNLLTCSFNAINNGINKTKSLLDTRFGSLLLVLCWYTFQPHHTSQVSGIFKDADLLLS
ncbi:MAG: hypothetical protein IPO01_08670 [Chitinophagaceae bacterium]|nr:hypothetical protein [Chitinophagaceae bacterium]MBK7308823.1 hypothetical protein [Chitinophagaceae bacterium]MBK8785961.1 hypothetical protein [Chitinophagaceae bacterium]MBK9485277.1 hypothetical protein [Chitinophagaceae bacterium]MBL0199843.1 hypothetical protein [Chitinophagaceae bacterium]